MAASPISVTPTTVPAPAVINPQPDNNYVNIYAKCGETPLLPEYFSATSADIYSPKLWSPDCHYIVWSTGSNLFFYNQDSQKVSQIYTSTSGAVFVKSWLDNNDFIFHLSSENTDYVYNLSTQSTSPQ